MITQEGFERGLPFYLIPMKSNQNFKIVLAAHLTLTEMDGKLVLFSKNTGDFFGLNESAGLFLKRLLESDFENSLAFVKKEFDAPEGVLRSDFLSLIEGLEKNKLVTKIPV